MKFNENLRNLRKEKDYSQEYLAERLGVSRQTISKWENATAMPDLKKLTEIAELFEIGINELLGFQENSNDSNDKTIEIVYSNQKLEAEISNLRVKADNNHKYIIVLFVLIAVLIIALIITNISSSNDIKNISDRIDSYRSEVLLYQNNNNNSVHYDNDELEYKVTGFSKEKENYITVELKYEPEKITKGATVTIQYYDNGTQNKAECEMVNNTYVTTVEIPISSNDESIFDVFIDNGDEITKQDYYLEIETSLFIVNEMPSFRYSSTTHPYLQPDYYNFKVVTADIINIKSAKLIAKDSKGDIMMSSDLKQLSTNNNSIYYDNDDEVYLVDDSQIIYAYSIDKNSLDKVRDMPAKLYYEFIDENNNVFTYYEWTEEDNGIEPNIVQINADKK